MTCHSPNRICLLAFQAAVVAACASALPSPAAAGSAPNMPRVRDNGDPSIAGIIREATERSPTFRRLVETIDETDGIVYVEQGKSRNGVRACLALTVTVAGPNRILRIVVDTRTEHAPLIAAIGHELRHAVEVLSDRAVTNNNAIFFFFHREGPTAANDSKRRRRFEQDWKCSTSSAPAAAKKSADVDAGALYRASSRLSSSVGCRPTKRGSRASASR